MLFFKYLNNRLAANIVFHVECLVILTANSPAVEVIVVKDLLATLLTPLQALLTIRLIQSVARTKTVVVFFLSSGLSSCSSSWIVRGIIECGLSAAVLFSGFDSG